MSNLHKKEREVMHVVVLKHSEDINDMLAMSSENNTSSKLLSQKYSTTLFCCHYCSFKATKSKNLLGHLKRTHANEAVKKQEKLHVLSLTKSEGDKYYCEKCDFQTTKRKQLKSHSEQHKKSLLSSRIFFHGNYAFRCLYCSFKELHFNALLNHVRDIHMENINDYKKSKGDTIIIKLKDMYKKFVASEYLGNVITDSNYGSSHNISIFQNENIPHVCLEKSQDNLEEVSVSKLDQTRENGQSIFSKCDNSQALPNETRQKGTNSFHSEILSEISNGGSNSNKVFQEAIEKAETTLSFSPCNQKCTIGETSEHYVKNADHKIYENFYQKCNNSFISHDYLKLNIIASPGHKPAIFSCVHCNKGFLSEISLKQHNISSMRCKLNSVESNRTKNILKLAKSSHGTTGHQSTIYPLQRTSAPLSNDIHQQTELTTKSNLDYKCSVCSHNLTDIIALEQHVKITGHKGVTIRCPECNSFFAKWSALAHHKKVTGHTTANVCQGCSTKFESKSALKQHMQITRDKKHSLLCIICNVLFPKNETLEQHIKISEHK